MNEVKLLSETDTHAVFGGYGVVFGGKDLEGDTFTQSTDFELSDVPVKKVFVDHSLDSYIESAGRTIKLTAIDDPVGNVIEVVPDDVGLYMRYMVEKAGRYWNVVDSMYKTGKMGLSTGSVSHRVKREQGRIKRWPIYELSMTLTPAEPRTVSVHRLKQLADDYPELAGLVPEESGDDSAIPTAGGDAAVYISQPIITFSQEAPMTDEVKAVESSRIDALDAKISALSDVLTTFVKTVQDSAPLKQAGYLAPDSETDHASIKSFGDFLVAVARGNTKRLASVYGAIKDLSEGVGGQGGFLVPVEYQTRLLEVTADVNPILSRVTRIPVATDSGRFPVLDTFATPTAAVGATPYAAGITAATTAERVALTETQSTFEELTYRINKVGGYTEVSNELLADSPISVEALLTRLFRVAINAKLENYIINGSGVGAPLGIFNADCAIGVTTASDNVFAEADALGILAKHVDVSRSGNTVWIMHRSIIPDLGNFTASNQDFVDWRSPLGATLLGYPIIFSDYMPLANADAVLLADLGAYLLFERQGLQIAFSEHAAFTTDKGTWKFTLRVDGMPWLKGVINEGGPSAYTRSPFVYHND